MSVISWSDELKLGVGFVDVDHREAVELINEMAAASGQARLGALRRFLRHCDDHFGREEGMMRETEFFALVPHQDEHDRVIAELRTVLKALEAGDAQDDYFAKALPEWFLTHRQTMDAVTADWARKKGFPG